MYTAGNSDIMNCPGSWIFFDRQTYAENPMKFTVVCTDLDTGKPVYHECPNGDVEDIEWMRASHRSR